MRLKVVAKMLWLAIILGAILLLVVACDAKDNEFREVAELNCHDQAILHDISEYRLHSITADVYIVYRCEFKIDGEWVGAELYMEWLKENTGRR